MSLLPRRVAMPPARPLVLYDGDCGFCKFWVERWRSSARERIDYRPYQTGPSFPEIPASDCAQAVQLIEPEGTVLAGADAVFRIVRGSRWSWLAWLAKRSSAFHALARFVYAFIATHRSFFSALTRMGWGTNPLPPSFGMARRVFAQGLGVIFFTAFGSLAFQWRGLIGSGGILPAAAWMELVREHFGPAVHRMAPSVFWLNGSDGFLLSGIMLGLLLSLVLACGWWPGPCALGLWILYLSFCSISSPFFDFQWDALLLETALLALVFLPWSFRPHWRLTTRVTTVGRWLLWWLLARLMFESAVVKLSSGDPTWRNLTAMTFHYETQPLPLWTAWWANQSPLWMHKLEVLATLAVEFAAPVALFGPRRFRHAAAWAVIALQVAILATGNFAFFNWLAILLSLLLFEDAAWPWRWRATLLRRLRPPLHVGQATWSSWIAEPASVLVLVITGALFVGTFDRSVRMPRLLEKLIGAAAPFRSFNSYGLFAVMTTQRPEIVIEGSNDGSHWQEYEFKWKPGNPDRMPRLAAPHQPRLDWQMWFAALDPSRPPRWFVKFMERLLRNSPDVTHLLEWNPFPGTPPRYLRAELYRYRFKRFGEGRGWWKRELLGEYYPAVSLRGNQD